MYTIFFLSKNLLLKSVFVSGYLPHHLCSDFRVGQFVIWTYATLWSDMELYKEIYSENERRYGVCALISLSYRSTKSFVVWTIGLHMLCTGTLDLTFPASVLLPWLCRLPQSGEKLGMVKSITVILFHFTFVEHLCFSYRWTSCSSFTLLFSWI
jgi:hypothetical protein